MCRCEAGAADGNVYLDHIRDGCPELKRQTLGRGSVLPSPSARHEDHEPGSFTDCLQCEAIAGRRAAEIGRALALNPNPGHLGPYPASLFLERAVAHDGPIRCPNFQAALPGGDMSRDFVELTLLSNFTPLGRLFALAAMADLDCPGPMRWPGAAWVVLSDPSELPETSGHLKALVCYQSGDGFDIGVKQDATMARRFPETYERERGLRLEPGTALIVYGGAAVGVAGWVRGSPVRLMAPEGASLLGSPCPQPNCDQCSPLLSAIKARWAERSTS